MEIHRPHKQGKKVTHYLWEFLMLFLAVFCGFLAENMREHHIEKKRAKELAISLYNELTEDSVTIKSVISYRQRKEAALVYLQKYYADSSILVPSTHFGLNFLYGYIMYSAAVFEPRDVILDQLKNSGSLRYFKNNDLQDMIGNLAMSIANLRKRNEYEWTFYHEYILPFCNKHNDMDFYDHINYDPNQYFIPQVQEYEKSGKHFPFTIARKGEFDKITARNITGTYRLMIRGSSSKQYLEYELLNQQLLKELRKEYVVK